MRTGPEITVTPEQHNSGRFTIPQAIDRAIASRGCVVLTKGTFFLQKPLYRAVRSAFRYDV